MLKRREIRDQFSIKGDEVEDCIVSACCPVCSLVQQEKEVINRQHASENARPMGGVRDQEGYVPPEHGMEMG